MEDKLVLTMPPGVAVVAAPAAVGVQQAVEAGAGVAGTGEPPLVRAAAGEQAAPPGETAAMERGADVEAAAEQAAASSSNEQQPAAVGCTCVCRESHISSSLCSLLCPSPSFCTFPFPLLTLSPVSATRAASVSEQTRPSSNCSSR